MKPIVNSTKEHTDGMRSLVHGFSKVKQRADNGVLNRGNMLAITQ